jgi:deazaflavin-dependent oxidoreductase (nitroreductase family)
MSTTQLSSTSTSTSTSQHKPGAFRLATRLFNPLAMRLAGTRIFPLYGVLEHRGRRSGKQFRTPVVVRPTSDGFIVPMPWGESTDWYRNVRAAGGAVIRWNGRLYPVDRPEVLDTDAVRGSVSPFQQKGMTRFGIRKVLHLQHRALAA